jgi:pimeloyl-ACP methyl ester carboxylesterase
MFRTLAAGMLGLLGTTMISGQVLAQLPPSAPTAAEAAAATTRQGSYFNVNGARLFYQVQGAGVPLLLIHGFPLSGELYRGQLAELSNEFKVITPDLRGFGKSTTPDANGSIVTYAHDILALMDHLKIERAIIGGHSMGGQVTLELYKEAPQRFLGMMLIDTNPSAPSTIEAGEFNAFSAQVQQIGVPSIVPILTPQMLSGGYRATNPAGTAVMSDILAEGSVDGVAAGGQALATRGDYNALLPTITVPTLVLVGLNDNIYSYEVSELTRVAIPFSRLVVIPPAEHAPMFEKPLQTDLAIAEFAGRIRRH